MARPYFTARHIESMALLPPKLEIGRVYFVDDEQVLIIDHGTGPVVYGKSAGAQGPAGEPQPSLQYQLDKLAEASLMHSKNIWDISQRVNANLQHTDSDVQEKFDFVKNLTERNAEAITSIISTIHEQFNRYDSAVQILAKAISELSPVPEKQEEADPLDNETIYTENGAYTIQQTVLDDGTVILNLTPQEQVIDTLKAGDSVDFDGATWTVEEISTEGGTTSITIRP